MLVPDAPLVIKDAGEKKKKKKKTQEKTECSVRITYTCWQHTVEAKNMDFRGSLLQFQSRPHDVCFVTLSSPNFPVL